MRRQPGRTASLNWGLSAFSISAVVLAGLITYLAWKPERELDRTPLVVFCAAGLKSPVAEAAEEYEKEYGVPVSLTYGGSETLLANIQVSGKGDLYIPADSSYIEQARSKDLLDEDIPVARMTPVVAVKKGNPKKIRTLADLMRKDVAVCQANPDAAAIGKVTREALRRLDKWDALNNKTLVSMTTVNEVASAVSTSDKVDVGIVWDATAFQFSDRLDKVELDELKDVRSNITVGVIRTCNNPAAALRFARFLSARDQGLKLFDKHGFVPVPDGDLWKDGEPLLHLHAGAMLQPAVEETIKAFERREGLPRGHIRVNYNGCGVLVSQMKAGQRPDAFFACDARFLDSPMDDAQPDGRKIKDLFLDATDISTNQLVILVRKGNPKKIRSLRDLARDGMRIGVGDEHKCAMGVLTEETLSKARVKDKAKKNITVKSGTGDQLVNQFLAAPDKLDAVVAYVSNGLKAADKLDAVPIDLDCNLATQPVSSKHHRRAHKQPLHGGRQPWLMGSRSYWR